MTNAERVSQAIDHLRVARELLKDAGSVRAVERVRGALRSADGALWHAELEPYRQERQGSET
jgi:hypothetical protein